MTEQLNGFVIWFTGLPSSGKTTLATELRKLYDERGIVSTFLLDGDSLRAGLNRDLGFSDKDRSENIRRAAEVSKLLSKEGNCVLATFISPLEKNRASARQIIGNQIFIEVYVKCPSGVCEQRDVKGLYAKARQGLIDNFTGISSPYEEPSAPEIVVNTNDQDINSAVRFLEKEIGKVVRTKRF